jgi:L1 cell adhesion molecule like protein
VLIYDLAGGTFYVSILTTDVLFKLMETAGNILIFGSDDFDNRLVSHLADEPKSKFKGGTGRNQRLRHLRTSTEQSKPCLPVQRQAFKWMFILSNESIILYI